ncbi:MAG: HAD-IIB family hydrolase [Haliscomenobacter sp.]|uniref:HAD-IIB family hydrolase n=1 Tax=Haliscomenobacter sp. TaxID=2717303 RepID=UPI0029AB2BC8|nr:HAD-IIB family hydrolase [Haliscomenobacter sp.]MDX2068033.1 HAD-IIB family hydrolase [Haliscomenobacter sp.]
MIQLPITSDQALVLFSDLDGTLIDHHTYDTRASEGALRLLVGRSVPLVFCSSKTFAEQSYLQRQLGMRHPFIFENGSAVAIPDGFFPEKWYSTAHTKAGYDIVVFAHADALNLGATLQQIGGLKGYKVASDAELSAATGLSGDALIRARERWFTETLLSPLAGEHLREVENLLQAVGYSLSRGGRFFTVQSARVNKGKAVLWMMELFRQNYAQSPVFAAIGDSPNDVPMLEVVNVPFLVQRPDQTWAEVEIPQIIRIDAIGPSGFDKTVKLLLE